MRSRHEKDDPINCPRCLTNAAKRKSPFETDVVAHIANQREQYRREHRRAVTRQERDQAMRDLGLVKVRGALGGTYWE